MILLDTDHVNVLKYPGRPQFVTFMNKMNASADQDFATTIITVEEQMRGWLALIHRWDDAHRQVTAYRELLRLFDFFSRWDVLSFDEQAAEAFQRLHQQRLRMGTMDRKIAAIALVHDALLLSANLRDFQRVPNLRVANWIH